MSRATTILPLLSAVVMGLAMPANGEPPVEDPSKAPFQACLLPLDIENIQNTALAELLKLRPELKADDLKVSQLMYMLTPDPDYSIQEEKDGTKKKFYLSSNYQQLSVAFTVLSSAHDGQQDGEPATVHDLLFVNFPNARYDKFTVSKGTSTQRK